MASDSRSSSGSGPRSIIQRVATTRAGRRLIHFAARIWRIWSRTLARGTAPLRRPSSIDLPGLWQAYTTPGSVVEPSALASTSDREACLRFLGNVLDVAVRNAVPESVMPEEQQRLKTFIQSVDSGQMLRDCLRQLIQTGTLVVPGPLDGQPFQLVDSLSTPDRLNCLRFEHEGRALLVLQFVTSFDMLVLPDRNLAIQFSHAKLGHLAGLMSYLAQLPTACSWSAPRAFGGFQVHHGRPGHFFYDVACAVEFASDLLREYRGPLWYYRPFRFAPLARILDGELEDRPWAGDELNHRCRTEGLLTFHVGKRFDKTMLPYLHSFDRRFRAAVPGLVDAEFRARIDAQLLGKPLVLWFGVTGQKRSWLEQVDGIAGIINQISESQGVPAVIFDGWTCAMDEPPVAKAVAEDLAIVAEIKKRIGALVPTLSTVGMTSVQKVYVAQYVHCFLSNHTTGSIHVSRFAARPGVTHSSNAIGAAGHVHADDVFRIPPDAIQDVRDSPESRRDFISYSFSWKLAGQMMVSVLERSGVGRAQ